MSYLMNEFIKFTYLSANSQAQEEKTNTKKANPFRMQVEDLHIFFCMHSGRAITRRAKIR